MCARLNQQISSADIRSLFDVVGDVTGDLTPKYNTAPTQTVTAITGISPRTIGEYRWGLIPFWAKDSNIGRRMFNARSETLDSKPSFRAAFRSRRCLIPAAGFYEWMGRTGKRQPVYVYRTDGQPLAIAGLWEKNENLGVTSCTIVTTAPNQMMSRIHNRMPVIVEEERWDEWLDPSADDIEVFQSILVAPTADTLTLHPVHPRMGNPRFNEPSAIEAYRAAV